MDLEDYKNLPEGMSKEEVETLCLEFLNDFSGKYSEDVLDKINIICDKQWHTYELPSGNIMEAMSEWLDSYCEIEAFSSDIVMRIAYCFGLEKKIFEKVAKVYGQSEISEYKEDLQNSSGDRIDPYWSLRERQ